jgi:OOP family OmpA-OmpF porin
MRSLPLLLTLTASVAVADTTKYDVKDNKLAVPHEITYQTGKAILQPASDAAITYVKGFLDAKSFVSTLRIEVHSDSGGKAEFTQKLTEERALAVAKALVAKGVDCKRLIAVGFGETKPVADNSTTEGKAKNRRTEFILAAMRGKNIGGMPADGGGKIAGDPCK